MGFVPNPARRPPPAFLLALTVGVVGASVVLATLAYLPTGPPTVFPVASSRLTIRTRQYKAMACKERFGAAWRAAVPPRGAWC